MPLRALVGALYDAPHRSLHIADYLRGLLHPGGNPEENLKPISHRCHPILVAFVWELSKETIHLPLGCLQGGRAPEVPPSGT